jgi:D-sedoheptulose 7-phosphate isomerase
MRETIARAYADAVAAHQRMAGRDPSPVVAAIEAVVAAVERGGKVLAFGNGGSAADAQHFAAEFVARYARTRRALPALALTADTSVLTAVGNDLGYERVFARQIEALGRAEDVAVGISTSGRSANVLGAIEAARAAGLTTIAITGGDGGPIGRAADIHVNVAETSTPLVQQVHRTILHVMCEVVEKRLAPGT